MKFIAKCMMSKLKEIPCALMIQIYCSLYVIIHEYLIYEYLVQCPNFHPSIIQEPYKIKVRFLIKQLPEYHQKKFFFLGHCKLIHCSTQAYQELQKVDLQVTIILCLIIHFVAEYSQLPVNHGQVNFMHLGNSCMYSWYQICYFLQSCFSHGQQNFESNGNFSIICNYIYSLGYIMESAKAT